MGRWGDGEMGRWGDNLKFYYQLPITNYQLPIPNSQLPITNSQLPITNRINLFVKNCFR
ncbi:hypothetical protein [Rivularia sp. UHCC 0363]|uniref:hypothetical protein n=1 Tax=Rivularia sp. UHCC 0363 TaxID=3110244 RepID=UPI002B1F9EAD|nr:hypothetical protein [Rivularia sp. UHCC 0363]MEA5596104.1 hypothetical protein [Rivularia sp. UHCC 0363]